MPESPAPPDSWPQWSNKVLSDLERLNANFLSVNVQMMQIQTRLEAFQFGRLMQDLEVVAGKLSELDTKLILLDDKLSGETGLIRQSQDFENRIRFLESHQNRNTGKNTIIAAIVTMVLSAAVSAFISSFDRGRDTPKSNATLPSK